MIEIADKNQRGLKKGGKKRKDQDFCVGFYACKISAEYCHASVRYDVRRLRELLTEV